MRFWKRPWLVISLLGSLLLGAVQLGTYWAYGQRTMPAAALRMYETEGKQWDFIALDAGSWAAMTPEQRADLEAILRRHAATLYFDVADVRRDQMVVRELTPAMRANLEKLAARPDTSRELLAICRRDLARGYTLAGYKNGMSLRWQRVSGGLFWMRTDSGYWMSNMGAAGGQDLYVWVLGRWVRVRDYGHFML